MVRKSRRSVRTKDKKNGQRTLPFPRLPALVHPSGRARAEPSGAASPAGSYVPHATRPEIRGPAHVVLQMQRGLPSLAGSRAQRVLERCFELGREKKGFRLLDVRVQPGRLHLVVEADGKRTLTRGMQGLMIRIAKNLNRTWDRKVGQVFADRYLAVPLAKASALRIAR